MADPVLATNQEEQAQPRHGENRNGVFASAHVSAAGVDLKTSKLGALEGGVEAGIDKETKVAKLNMCNIF